MKITEAPEKEAAQLCILSL